MHRIEKRNRYGEMQPSYNPYKKINAEITQRSPTSGYTFSSKL